METPNVIALISAIAAVGSVVFAFFVWRISKGAMVHQALADVQKDYRSPGMLLAIDGLWEIYRDNGKEHLADKYKEVWDEEKTWISSLPRQDRVKAVQGTLHYQRRLVSTFYQHLAALYCDKILPESIVFREWPEGDLKIIPEIIVPIEKKIGEVLDRHYHLISTITRHFACMRIQSDTET